MGDYTDRLKMIERNIPQLLANPGKVLYVGARKDRCDYVQELYDAGASITVFETYQKNAYGLYDDERVDVYWVDVLDPSDTMLYESEFEWIVWFQGPEHAEMSEVVACIKNLERAASKGVVLTTPIGRVEQGASYGNPYEVHRSFWMPEDFERLGYKTDSIGNKDELGSCILAWKETGNV